jgi:hypothetical protein
MEVKMPFVPFRPQWPKVLLAVVFLVALIVLGVLAVVYRFPDSLPGRLFAERFPFPVVMIGGGVAVTTDELARNMQAIRRFYETQDFAQLGMRVDFTTSDGKKRLKIREKDLVNKMLEDKAIELMARERGITVTREDVEVATTGKMKELGTTEKVEETLARLYGWTVADFQEKVVWPSLFEEALYEVYTKEVSQDTAKQRIDAAAQALSEKTDFSQVAKRYSDGQTKNEGGDLGWFILEDLAPELRGPVDVARPGTPTGVIESNLGYHIVLVEDSKIENGERLYHLRQIFARKVSFGDWLSEAMKRMPISVLARDYVWIVDEARIEFRDETMREFEKRMRENAESDPSLLF